MDDPDVTEDALLGGTVRLLQVRTGHRAGTDAVLLAGLAGARDGDRVVDLGSASGAVGLMVAARVRVADLVFVDRDAALVELCRRNAVLNGLADRATALAEDALAGPPSGSLAGRADLVVTNPPFFDRREPASPDAGRKAAHQMGEGGLAAWIDHAAGWLRPRGRLALIHRADALPACLAALAPHFGSLALVPVHPRADRPAHRIVVRAVKGGRSPIRIEPPLVLHDTCGMTPRAVSMHGPPVPTSALPA